MSFSGMLSANRGAILMANRDAYFFYEAGQAVAAVHLGLNIRHISGNPAALATDIQFPRGQPKARLILWMTGMAAEKKGAGASDPLRRTRNRMRIRAQIESLELTLRGSKTQRHAQARLLLNQSQDRANAICANLYDAIAEVAQNLKQAPSLAGEDIETIVRRVKARRQAEGKIDAADDVATNEK